MSDIIYISDKNVTDLKIYKVKKISNELSDKEKNLFEINLKIKELNIYILKLERQRIILKKEIEDIEKKILREI